MQVESMMGQFRNLVKQMSDDELHEAGIYLTQQLTKKEDFVEVNIFSIRNHILGQCIPNGCLDAYEVKVNIDIFQCQEKLKLISQFQRFFSFFNDLLEFCFTLIK